MKKYSEFKDGNYVVVINNIDNSGDLLGTIYHIHENKTMLVKVKGTSDYKPVDLELSKGVELSERVLVTNFETVVINGESYYKYLSSNDEELLINFINRGKILKNGQETTVKFVHELQNWYFEQFNEPIHLDLKLGENC